MANLNVKKDDVVIVLSGDDKGAKGKVIATSPEEGKVIVEGVNIIHKHVKARRQGETSGIVDAEGAIYASKCDKGVRTKIQVVDGKKIRVCAKCGKEI